MIRWRHRHGTALVLVLAGDRLAARRLGGSPSPAVHTRLAVDPLTGDTALAARELSTALEPLGPRPRGALVCLPLDRLLTTTVDVPAMTADLVPGFMRLQAERVFNLPPAQLWLGWSPVPATGAARRAVLTGIPAAAVAHLRQMLRPLGIRQFQIVPTALAVAGKRPPAELLLLATADTVDLVASGADGVALLRRLAGPAADTHPPQPNFQTLRRELRISLGQLPDPTAARVRLLAPAGVLEGLAEAVSSVLPAGTPCAAVATDDLLDALAPDCQEALTAGQPVPWALRPGVPDHRFAWVRQFSRRQVLAAVAVALLTVLTPPLLFLYQSLVLHGLRAECARLEPRAAAVRAVVADFRSQQAWWTDEAETLELLRAITLAFPETGSVNASRLEIRDRRQVVLSGVAVSRSAWLQVLERLRQTPGVDSLRVAQAREAGDGRSQLSFIVSFVWQPPRRLATDEGALP